MENQINSADLEALKKLETSMWLSETRFDVDYMERTLTSDFFEFGRSGRVYTKAQTVNAPAQPINATLPLENFSAVLISEGVALVTYVSKVQYDVLEVANRSSIWVNTADGWKLRFHQGTPVIAS